MEEPNTRMLCKECCEAEGKAFDGEAYWARCEGKCDGEWKDTVEVKDGNEE